MAPDTVHPPDYKATLCLPRTNFPMRAGLPQREPEWLARWARIGVYERLRSTAAGRPPFVLHDGPPYANGHLHIGHALNKVLKDMVVRSRQMMGYDARFIPGWDCHGLPIEWKIEEEYRARSRNKDEIDVVLFRQECRRFAEHWVGVQSEEFKRLGVTGDWDNPYRTMDFHAEATIAAEFQKFLMNGALYQGSKPVMWSPVEKTALAEAEVEYHEATSHQVWVRFKFAPPTGSYVVTAEAKAQHALLSPEQKDELERLIEDGRRGSIRDASVVIWTTTPWTIPQNRAVAYNPEVTYGLFEVTSVGENSAAKLGERVILADNLAKEVFAAGRVDGFERIRTITAKDFIGMPLAHPFRGLDGADGEWDYDVPMLPGEHVTDDAGTGFVHTAPSHGDDDYQLGLRFGLPMTYNVGEDGSYRPDLPLFGGQHIILPDGKEGPANVSVIRALAQAGALFAKGKLRHSYPHSWRSKAPLIFRNTPQWFAAIDKPLDDGMGTYGDTIRKRALTSIDTLVEWTPRTGRNRLHSMVEARPDWVLSRQRAWGVPLTCFVKKGAKPTDEDFLLRDPAVNARVVAAFEAEGADCWYAEGAKQRFLGPDHDPEAYDQVFDVLDVWFDSGSTHAFVLRDRPDGSDDGLADLYLEGTDQHRGWFHSSLLQASGTIGRAPYRAVLTHGFTLDEKGLKMSKSLGNATAPAQVVEQYGADILRLWVAQSDYTADLRIGPEILKGTADGYRRLRNTMRFLLGSLADLRPEDRVEPAEMPELERWVLHRLAELDEAVRQGYAAYDFTGVVRAVFDFATADLSAFYFDVRKDALYCDGDTPRRRAARTVLGHLFERLTTWLAPVLPFTMEEVWLERHPGEGSSVHLQDFPETPAAWRLGRPGSGRDLLAEMHDARRIRRVVLGALEVARRDKDIGSSLEAAPRVWLDEQHPDHAGHREAIAGMGEEAFADLCITSGIEVSPGAGPAEAFRLADVPGVAVGFGKAGGDKCQRCWKVLPDVGTHPHPGVCLRCDEALGELGAPVAVPA